MREREIDREILIASVLGDGCLVRHKKQDSVWLQLKHSTEQEDYLRWKARLIEGTSFAKGKTFTIRSKLYKHRNGKQYPICTAHMYGVKYFRILRQWMYPNNRKSVRRVLQYLKSPLALAIWFMDDGSVNRRKRKHKDGTPFFLSPSMQLALCEDLDECAVVLSWLLERFSIEGYPVRLGKNDYFILNFNVENAKKIWELIGPFTAGLKSMVKKFDLCFEKYPDLAQPQVARVLSTPRG